MLVLTRKKNEEVVIDVTQFVESIVKERLENPGEVKPIETIRVIVAEIGVNKVRLGINAPKAIPVHRLEVYNQINKKQG